MNFIYPEFLYALAALAIPILIHLFNFRKFKKIRFSNVQFIRDVKQETRSRSRLKHLLVLLARLLALAFLVLAFAQPYLPSDENTKVKGEKGISVYVDNSFSMDGENQDGRLIDIAKEQAIRISESYTPTDRYQLVTNELEGKQQRWLSQQDQIEEVEEVEVSPETRSMSRVISRQKDLINSSGSNGRVFFISDLQRSVTDLEQLKADTNTPTYILPIQPEAQKNLYVDSVWFRTPVRKLGEQEELSVRIVNSGDEKVSDIPVELIVDGKKKALGSFNVDGQSYTDTSLFYTHSNSGIHHAKVNITDHPVTFDDEFFFSYEVAGSIPILRISPSKGLGDTAIKDPFEPVYEGDELFRFDQAVSDNIDYSSLDGYDLIILDRLPKIPSGLGQELNKFIKHGGSLTIYPSRDPDRSSYNEFLGGMGMNTITGLDTSQGRVRTLSAEHPLYQNIFESIPENIDLPVIHKHFTQTKRVRSREQVLLKARNGDSFLSTYPQGKGKVYVFTVPPITEFTNLTRHAIFPTTMLRIAELSHPSGDLYHIIGTDQGIELRQFDPSGDQVLHLKDIRSELDIIPEQEQMGGITNVHAGNRVNKAGNFELQYEGKPLKGIGFNYSRKESDLSYFTPDELRSKLSSLGLNGYRVIDERTRRGSENIGKISEGTRLWWACIILALVFIGVEVLLLAFSKSLGLES